MSTTKLPPVRTPPLSLVQYDNEVESLMKNSFFENGRCYTVQDSNIRHELPPTKNLQPCVDQKSGKIDKWPAQSTNLYMATNEKPQPKPKFLLKLETYLEKELRILGCQDTIDTTEERLQGRSTKFVLQNVPSSQKGCLCAYKVFREVFGYLIDNFRTYKPLLSTIKHEYETMLSIRKETIRDLEPLKSMLVNLNDQCEQKVLNLKQEEKLEILNLKKENSDLHSKLHILKDEIVGLQRQVERCQEEVAEGYKKYRDESDARKLLIQDINDLKYQQDEAKRALNGGETAEGKEEDPIMLRLALRKAREDLDLKTHRLAEVLADYGDVVPRREFENLENQFKEMEDKFEDMKSNHETLIREHSALLDIHKKVIIQRDEFATDCEKMRRSATPRPDWSKCGRYIEGGTDRWEELIKEKATTDKMDVLLSEMTGQDINLIKAGTAVMIDFFEPKGSGDDIPLYLRSDERVRNRRLTKRDLCVTIKDVWQEKVKKEGSSIFLSRTPLQEFLCEYLQQRYTIPAMATEWAYNIHDAFTRYNFDKYIAMFAGIMNGEFDEDIYYSQLSQLEDLYRLFTRVDTQNVGVITKEELFQCLEDIFSYYPTDDISKIIYAAEEELGGLMNDNLVPYRDLFTEDDEGKSGAFITMLHDLSKQQKENYLNEIEAFLENNNSDITAADVREAIQKYDSKIAPKLCEQYVNLAFRDKNGGKKLSKDIVMKNLRCSCIRRT